MMNMLVLQLIEWLDNDNMNNNYKLYNKKYSF